MAKNLLKNVNIIIIKCDFLRDKYLEKMGLCKMYINVFTLLICSTFLRNIMFTTMCSVVFYTASHPPTRMRAYTCLEMTESLRSACLFRTPPLTPE